jgi:hypothetical protein
MSRGWWRLCARSIREIELCSQTKDEILGPTGRGDHAIGQGFFEFSGGCASILRDREVFLQSGRAADRHRAGYPDQLPVLDVQDFLILEIENFLAHLHPLLLSRSESVQIRWSCKNHKASPQSHRGHRDKPVIMALCLCASVVKRAFSRLSQIGYINTSAPFRQRSRITARLRVSG